MAEVIQDPRIVDLMASRRQKSGNKAFATIEFFPPKTTDGVENLWHVLENLKTFDPVFADVTWNAGGSSSDLTLELCKGIKARGIVPNMHLTCTNMEVQKIDAALQGCKEAGICNLLALRGDPPAGQSAWTATDVNLTCALDLVNYIRSKHGDYFCIAVAGYPEGHPTKMVEGNPDELSQSERGRSSVEVDETTGKQTTYVCRDADFVAEIEYLKKKVDAGAEFIVTQMFFCADVFATFVSACREAGILVPILPGIMCISTYAGFKRMTKFCKTRVPEDMAAKLEAIKDDEKAVKQFGVEYGGEMCRKLLAQGVPGLHIYTLNASTVAKAVLEQVRELLDVPQLAPAM